MYVSPLPKWLRLLFILRRLICCWFVVNLCSLCVPYFCPIICCALFCVPSSFELLIGKKELAASICLSSWCLEAVFVLWLFLPVRLVCLQYVIVFLLYHTRFFVSPAKHGRHIRIMPSSSALSQFWFPFDNFEGMHQCHSKFTEGSSIIRYRSSSKRGWSAKFWLSYDPFLTYILAKLWFRINSLWRDATISFKEG